MKILPVFIPFYGCKSRCIYCNQHAVTGTESDNILLSARNQISGWMDRETRWDEIAFYGGNFANLPESVRKELYEMSNGLPVRYSACPDSFTDALENEIKTYNVSTVEFGVQSLSDSVLKSNSRNYTYIMIRDLFKRLRGKVKLCAQMMTGLYTETETDILLSARLLAGLKADYVRIYPLLVLKDTSLEKLYHGGTYVTPEAHKIILRCAWLYISAVSAGSRIIRIGLPQEAAPHSVAGFYHPAMGELIRTTVLNAYINKYGSTSLPRNQALYGYKALLKKHFDADLTLQRVNLIDTMGEVTRRLKEAYGEGEQWFAEGENIAFSRLISGQADIG